MHKFLIILLFILILNFCSLERTNVYKTHVKLSKIHFSNRLTSKDFLLLAMGNYNFDLKFNGNIPNEEVFEINDSGEELGAA